MKYAASPISTKPFQLSVQEFSTPWHRLRWASALDCLQHANQSGSHLFATERIPSQRRHRTPRVYLGGPPGIGKSALVQNFAQSVGLGLRIPAGQPARARGSAGRAPDQRRRDPLLPARHDCARAALLPIPGRTQRLQPGRKSLLQPDSGASRGRVPRCPRAPS